MQWALRACQENRVESVAHPVSSPQLPRVNFGSGWYLCHGLFFLSFFLARTYAGKNDHDRLCQESQYEFAPRECSLCTFKFSACLYIAALTLEELNPNKPQPPTAQECINRTLFG